MEKQKLIMLEKIENGDADHERMVENRIDGRYLLPLEKDEYAVYRQFREHKWGKMAPVLRIKDSFRSAPSKNVLRYLDVITDAIQYKKKLEICHGTMCVRSVISPLKVFYNATENEYAIVTIDKNGEPFLYPLSDIESVKPLKKKFSVPETEALEKLHQLWGTEFKSDRVHARVRFYHEGNVHEKVKRDTANRKYATLTAQGKTLVFEDDVYGYDTFKAWVLGFGASAVVEKPLKLRNEIIREMKERLRQ